MGVPLLLAGITCEETNLFVGELAPCLARRTVFRHVLNPFPATGESIFRVWPSSPSVLARKPIKFGHFQPFSCGFLDCTPESRDPSVPHLACSPRFARAAP
eukprot:scaffold22910_cov67-Phaeocystis_antarctica.AAC.2